MKSFLDTTKNKLVERKAISCSSKINLANMLGIRPQNVVASPTLGLVLELEIISPLIVISTLRSLYTHRTFLCTWGIISKIEFHQFHSTISGLGSLWSIIASQTLQNLGTHWVTTSQSLLILVWFFF